MMFNQNKIPAMSGLTAVFLTLILFATTACDSDPESVHFALFATPVPVANIPLPSSATAVPVLSPTPVSQFIDDAEQLQFAPGSNRAYPQHDIAAGGTYTYTLYGLVGQQITVHMTAGHQEIMFTILDNNGRELSQTIGDVAMSAAFPADGTYFIRADAPHENGRLYHYSLAVTLTMSSAAPTTMVLDVPSPLPPTIAKVTAVPTPEVIIFEPDETIITKSGHIDGTITRQYQLAGVAGQTLTIFANASPPDIYVAVEGQDKIPLGNFRSGEIFTNTLSTTQNYFLNITSQISSAGLDYSLTIALNNPPPPPDPERITVSAGSTPMPLSDRLSQNAGKTYVFEGTQGQTLQIDPTSTDAGITISVRGADNSMLGWTTAGIPFSAMLPESQDYFISLMPPVDAVGLNYMIMVSLQ